MLIASYPGLPMFFNVSHKKYIEKHGKTWVQGYMLIPVTPQQTFWEETTKLT